MLRRHFIAALASVCSLPVTVSAQNIRSRRIGVLIIQSEKDSGASARVAAFREQMAQLGWHEGKNLSIDYRWGGGVASQAQKAAQELVALAPDLILSHGTPPTAALQKLTSSTPIVFVVVTDPVGAGFVNSLSRPGANITGFSSFEPEIGGKWLELLRDIAPSIKNIAAIRDPGFSGFDGIWREIEAKSAQLNLSVITIAFRSPSDNLEDEVSKFAQLGDGAMIAFPTALNGLSRHRLFAIAASQRLPTIYPFQDYPEEGGLIAYGFDNFDLFRRSASYVDRVLKGAKPADLPVQGPVKFELVINLQTARKLNLTVPPSLLSRADKVID